MDVAMVVIVGVDVVTGTVLSLCVPIFEVDFGLKSIRGPFGTCILVMHPFCVLLPCEEVKCWHKLS